MHNGTFISICGVVFEITKSTYRTKVMAIAMALKFVKYIGVHPTVVLPKNDPVRHPVSFFTRSLYTLFAQDRAHVAFSKYRRVNPTGELKLDTILKFDREHSVYDCVGEFIALADEYCPWTDDEFALRLRSVMTNYESFDDVTFDGSSAAGYPFKAGTKRRNAYKAAAEDALSLLGELIESSNPSALLKSYVHYATGRAKLVQVEDNDSCRPVIYQSFATFLIMQKYAETFTGHFSDKRPSWSAIGFSWFNGGATKLAMSLGLVDGMAPDGCDVCSSDVSNWDASLSPSLLFGACAFHCRIIEKTLPPEDAARWVKILNACYHHMVYADVVYPGGHTFSFMGGMKSGWNLTSVDNTIMHEIVFRRAATEAYGFVPVHKLYGDDNIFIAPTGGKHELLKQIYAGYGLTLKYVRTSKFSRDIDFLSKLLYYNKTYNVYYPFRETVESDARMLMPEDFDPSNLPASDAVASAEVIIGHLFDNFFNLEVRALCLKMLTHIRDNYDVQEVDPRESFRNYKHKGFGDAFRTKLPTVPSPAFIARLYGIPIEMDTGIDKAEACVTPPSYDRWKRAADVAIGVLAEYYARTVNDYCGVLSNVVNCRVRNMTRHFRLTYYSAGTAGLKFFEAMKRMSFNVKHLKTVLDVGGHPGSVCATIINGSPSTHVTTVSPMYDKDKARGLPFMPKAPIRECDRRIEMPFEKFVVDKDYTWVHIDVTFDELDRDVKYGSEASSSAFMKRVAPMIDKVIDHAEYVSVVLPSLSDSVVAVMHKYMSVMAEYDIFKPIYSHPWNTEVVWVFKVGTNGRGVRMKDLRGSARNFRNTIADRLLVWTHTRMLNGFRARNGMSIKRCELHRDIKYQRALLESVLPHGALKPRTFDVVPGDIA